MQQTLVAATLDDDVTIPDFFEHRLCCGHGLIPKSVATEGAECTEFKASPSDSMATSRLVFSG
jgi:hypothetical protein